MRCLVFGLAAEEALDAGGGVTTPYCDELRFNGTEYDEPTQRGRRAARRRCSTSKSILVDWPKKR